MDNISEILSIEATLQEALSKIEKIKRSMLKVPSKTRLSKQARIDHRVINKRAQILRQQMKNQ